MNEIKLNISETKFNPTMTFTNIKQDIGIILVYTIIIIRFGQNVRIIFIISRQAPGIVGYNFVKALPEVLQ